MLGRIQILRGVLFMIHSISEAITDRATRAANVNPSRRSSRSTRSGFVFFTRGDSISNLNEAMLYVRRNEHTNYIKVVIVYADKKEIPDRLEHDLEFLGEAYPDIDIEYIEEEGTFGPELIEKLSKRWQDPDQFHVHRFTGGSIPISVGGARRGASDHLIHVSGTVEVPLGEVPRISQLRKAGPVGYMIHGFPG